MNKETDINFHEKDGDGEYLFVDEDERLADFEDGNREAVADEPEKVKTTASPENFTNSIELYFKEIGYSPLLTAKEELEFAYEVVRGDRKAWQKMIESNLRLVIKIAMRHLNCGLDLADLIEEGNLGLMVAVEKFKPELGFRFSTYATWWIRQAVERAIMNHGRIIRLPVNVIRKLRNYKRKYAQAAKDLNHVPSSKELAAAMDISGNELQNILNLDSEIVSLDAPILGDQQDATFAEFLEDENSVDPVKVLLDENFSELMDKIIKKLDPQHMKILTRRFGLYGCEYMTFEEIAQELNVSREKVRQMQNNALKRLRIIMVEERLLE